MRTGLVPLVLIALLAAPADRAAAQAWPARPVRMIVPFPAGGPLDTVVRAVGKDLQARLGQPFVVENRPGAAGNVGAESVARAAPDGYTFLAVVAAAAINPSIQKQVPFDVTKDLSGVSMLAAGPFVLVAHPSTPFASVEEMIAYARANPGKLAYGSQGNGTVPHLGLEWLKGAAGVDLLHVPYKGAAPNIQAILAGETQVTFESTVATLPHVRAGKLKALGVSSTGAYEGLPGVPPIARAVAGYEIEGWMAVLAPAGTPMDVRRRLSTEIAAILRSAETAQLMGKLGTSPRSATPEEVDAFVRAEVEKWARVVREYRIQAD
jgi:tripartite-type tricarboxylate transporter receptor subunit TctC